MEEESPSSEGGDSDEEEAECYQEVGIVGIVYLKYTHTPPPPLKNMPF